MDFFLASALWSLPPFLKIRDPKCHWQGACGKSLNIVDSSNLSTQSNIFLRTHGALVVSTTPLKAVYPPAELAVHRSHQLISNLGCRSCCLRWWSRKRYFPYSSPCRYRMSGFTATVSFRGNQLRLKRLITKSWLIFVRAETRKESKKLFITSYVFIACGSDIWASGCTERQRIGGNIREP